MSVQFVSLDPSALLVNLMDNGKARSVPYSEAIADPSISNHLPHLVMDTICHRLAANLKKSKAS